MGEKSLLFQKQSNYFQGKKISQFFNRSYIHNNLIANCHVFKYLGFNKILSKVVKATITTTTILHFYLIKLANFTQTLKLRRKQWNWLWDLKCERLSDTIPTEYDFPTVSIQEHLSSYKKVCPISSKLRNIVSGTMLKLRKGRN